MHVLKAVEKWNIDTKEKVKVCKFTRLILFLIILLCIVQAFPEK